MTYRTIDDYTMVVGASTRSGIFVVASQPGSLGNCAIGEIDTIKSMPDTILRAGTGEIERSRTSWY